VGSCELAGPGGLGLTIDKDLLDAVLASARKHGVRALKVASLGLDVAFHPPDAPVIKVDHKLPIGEAHGMPTDDEMLFASSIPLTPEELVARAP